MSGRFACERGVAAEGLVALVLSGELDIETVPVFEAEIERVLADAPATVVLDLPSLEFLDSTGLRAILEAHERLREQGAQLVLTHGRPAVQLTFGITGLDTRLNFIDNLEQLTGTEPGKKTE
ncbi:MAG TPA: STAS domain-containing protein [Actinomycetota bacterium]